MGFLIGGLLATVILFIIIMLVMCAYDEGYTEARRDQKEGLDRRKGKREQRKKDRRIN